MLFWELWYNFFVFIFRKYYLFIVMKSFINLFFLIFRIRFFVYIIFIYIICMDKKERLEGEKW